MSVRPSVGAPASRARPAGPIIRSFARQCVSFAAIWPDKFATALAEGVRAESSLTLRTSLSTEGYEFGVAEVPHLHQKAPCPECVCVCECVCVRVWASSWGGLVSMYADCAIVICFACHHRRRLESMNRSVCERTCVIACEHYLSARRLTRRVACLLWRSARVDKTIA
jgi:hypothetical protein